MCKLHKLGIRFTPRKQQALLRGDTSGAILNPFFIYAAQSVGLDFCEDVNKSPAMIRLQAKYFQRASELLVEIFKGCNWELRAQAALWVTAGSIIMRLTHITPLYIGKSCEAADMAGLQFIPTYGQPPALSEDIQERSSVLSQIIYFENFWFLACGGAEPTMTARIEREFRQKLQVSTACHLITFTLYIQHLVVEGLPGIVQYLPIDHAHASHFVGQRHGGYARPSAN